MLRITLPPPSRGRLCSFWLVQSACAGFLAVIVGKATGVRQSALAGISLGLLMALAGYGWPNAVLGMYHKWDRWAATYAAWASRLLLKICYLVVFTLVGRAGSRMTRDRKRQSMWTPRTTAAAEAYESQSDLLLASGSQGWVRGYVGWASKSGHLWAVGLLPFLILIAALDPERSQGSPGSLYTLF
jgi:hypothetical protein